VGMGLGGKGLSGNEPRREGAKWEWAWAESGQA
jgi:hypothetical protein